MVERDYLYLFEDSSSDEDEVENNLGLSIFDSDSDESGKESTRMDITYFYEKTEDNSICWILSFSDTNGDSDYNEDGSSN